MLVLRRNAPLSLSRVMIIEMVTWLVWLVVSISTSHLHLLIEGMAFQLFLYLLSPASYLERLLLCTELRSWMHKDWIKR